MSRPVFIFVGVANYAQVAEAVAKADMLKDVVIVAEETQLPNPFAPEPIMITALPKLNENFEYYEPKPSKYFDKPKHNFKKQ